MFRTWTQNRWNFVAQARQNDNNEEVEMKLQILFWYSVYFEIVGIYLVYWEQQNNLSGINEGHFQGIF